jgi:hypothetical protein
MFDKYRLFMNDDCNRVDSFFDNTPETIFGLFRTLKNRRKINQCATGIFTPMWVYLFYVYSAPNSVAFRSYNKQLPEQNRARRNRQTMEYGLFLSSYGFRC